jgi:hypothetical protein
VGRQQTSMVAFVAPWCGVRSVVSVTLELRANSVTVALSEDGTGVQ